LIAVPFETPFDKASLAKALAGQELVQHDHAIASKFAEIARVDPIPEGGQLYRQGDVRKVLFFILDGSVDLSVDGKHVATLGSGQCVGEFPIIDPSLQYTVTAVASEEGWVASVSEEQFRSVASKYPVLWENMAKMLVTRLLNANRSEQ